MKFSLSSQFTRLTLITVVMVFVSTLGGYFVKSYGAVNECPGFPFCISLGTGGWIIVGHRIGVALAGAMLIWLLVVAWRYHRNERVVLPLTTVTATLFFGEVLIGAVQTSSDYPLHLLLLHGVTAVSLWLGLAALVLVSAYISPMPVDYARTGFLPRFKDFLVLTKPIVVLLLLVTTLTAFIAGLQKPPSFSLVFFTLLGGALAAGGSSAMNQFIDRDLDRNMQRTENRPLAAGRLTPPEGLAFALALCLLSYYILASFVNFTAALLSLAGIIYYVVVYSIFLKKASYLNIVIGGGAGAIPPMVGWAAATGRIDMVSILLFALVFFWTPPHFWALAIVRRQDYARAGVPMLPVVRGEDEARRQIWLYSLEMVGVSLLLPLFKLSGTLYLAAALILGFWIIWGAWQVWRKAGNKVAWQMYRWTSIYLLFIFLAFMMDAIV